MTKQQDVLWITREQAEAVLDMFNAVQFTRGVLSDAKTASGMRADGFYGSAAVLRNATESMVKSGVVTVKESVDE